MDLFDTPSPAEFDANAPLAVRMRPRSLDEYAGQQHLLGKGKLLRRAIEADRISSLILFGPPGTGKTSLAWCVAALTRARYVAVNAAASNVEELRKLIAEARRSRARGERTICFIDELHRFNKAQQDVLLPDVEEGNLILIGATVHNPYFVLTSALTSRSLVCELKALTESEVRGLIRRAAADKERGLGRLNLCIEDAAEAFLAATCEGDARRALNALEIGALTTPPDETGVIRITLEAAAESIQKKPVVYDKDEDAHYDTASAFIKSMRGSDPDAALYWMAKMLYAGEDPRFVARRICILAAEDVGNADPMALVVANAALQIAEFVGMPEARIPLAQAVVYVACAPKSNASYAALEKATESIRTRRVSSVPDPLKDASYSKAKELGRGQGYKYPHDHKDHYVAQDYMLEPQTFYLPTESGFEAKIKKRLEELRERKKREQT